MITQHWHAPAAEQEAVPSTHFLHAVGLHPPPLDEVDEPLLLLLPELELLTGMHAPALHVPLGVQSVQAAPPVPHTVSDCAEESWHVPLMSQQPFAQLVLSHVVPPLDPPVLLLVLVPPPSSPLEPPLLL
jgi:hypothetical protein